MSKSELARLTVKQLREMSQARGLPSYQLAGRRLGKADLIHQLLGADSLETIDAAPSSSARPPELADTVEAPAPTGEPTTVAQFRRLLAEYSILTEREVADLLATPAGWRIGADLNAFVATLVRVGLLSEWQCEKILDGAAEELRIDRYVLLAPVDEGGFGSVYMARHLLMDRIVAVKVLRSGVGDYDRMLARFRREATASGKLDHPNLLRAHDLVQFGSSAALVLEYVNGPNLHDLVLQNGPLPIPIACDCIRQAAWGLSHTHKLGMVHRDIKPSNMLLASLPEGTVENSWGTVKILDLGIVQWEDEEARNPLAADQLDRTDDAGDESAPDVHSGLTNIFGRTGAQRLTAMGSVLGTVEYMAPEQAEDPQSVDERADLYSLGATLFYLLTGKPPLSGEANLCTMIYRLSEVAPPKVRELRPDCPQPLESLVDRLLSKDPDARLASASEVADALGEFIARQSVAATPTVDEPVVENPVDDEPVVEETVIEEPVVIAGPTVRSKSARRSRPWSTKRRWRFSNRDALPSILACVAVVSLAVAWWFVAAKSDLRPDASNAPDANGTVQERDGGSSFRRGMHEPLSAASVTNRSEAAPGRSLPVRRVNRIVSRLE